MEKHIHKDLLPAFKRLSPMILLKRDYHSSEVLIKS